MVIILEGLEKGDRQVIGKKIREQIIDTYVVEGIFAIEYENYASEIEKEIASNLRRNIYDMDVEVVVLEADKYKCSYLDKIVQANIPVKVVDITGLTISEIVGEVLCANMN